MPPGFSLRRALALIAFACVVFASPGDSLDLRPKLRQGDVFQLEFTRTREDSRQRNATGKSHTPINVKVLQAASPATPTRDLVLDWSYGVTTFENPEAAKNPLVAAASKLVEDVHLEVILSSAGQYKGLRNQAEVAKKFQAMMDTLLASIGEQIADPARRQAVESGVRSLMSPQVQLASATRDVQTYFGLAAVAALPPSGKALEFQLQQPSPFGSSSIAAVFRLNLEAESAGVLKLSSSTSYDGVALAEMTAKMLEQAGQSLTEDVKAKMTPIKMQDAGSYIFDRSLGLMSSLIVTREMGMAPALQKKDVWEFTLSQPPAR